MLIVRFLDEWTVKQRLVSVQFMQKSLNGEELARQIISVSSVTLGIESGRLLAAIRDGASVNTAALRTVAIVYPYVLDICYISHTLLDICCISHTLDLVGEKLKATAVSLFFTLWVSLFAHSAKARALWWSRWEIMLQVLEQFGDVEPFLQENSDLSPATRSKLLDILHNPQSLTTLKLELAAVVDMGVHFVKATYRLEGDGLLILVCYEEILKIRAAIQSAWYPNIQAVAKNAFPSNPSLQSQWAAYAISCVQPGIDYFHKRLGDDQFNPMKAFKAARFLSPFKMNEIQPMAMDIDDLRAFPFLVGDISGLKTELPTYLAQAADVSTGVDTLRW